MTEYAIEWHLRPKKGAAPDWTSSNPANNPEMERYAWTIWSTKRQQKKATGLKGRQWVRARKAAQRLAKRQATK